MPEFLIEHVRMGASDSRGKLIDEVFSRVVGLFAIYRADGEVTVQYADTAEEGVLQRKALSPIRPLRGEIDGLVRKLMLALLPPGEDDVEEKRFYDRQVADALFMGLQGDIDMCRMQLESVRTSVRERLLSVGRMQVAKWTLVSTLGIFAAFAAIVIAFLVVGWIMGGSGGAAQATDTGTPATPRTVIGFVTETYLWAAAVFGALGAWLSIAIGLRSREVEPSTSTLDNLVDPTLRIIVAVLSATILFSLVHLGAFSVRIGDAEIAWETAGEGRWDGIHVAIILGIVAGFSERLVGNLLAKGEIAERRGAPPPPPSGQNATADERDPTGRGGGEPGGSAGGATVAQVAAAAVAATAAAAAAADEDTQDHSLDANPAQDDELTPDEDLPAAAGGVATDDGLTEEPK